MKKRAKFWFHYLAIFGLVLFLMVGCKKSSEDNNNPPANTVKDIDGNIYHTVTIGSQVWMVENLKTTKFNDGSLIPNLTDSKEWAMTTAPAYCWYDNSIGYKESYGALYNWYAVTSGKLCPSGWRVPTKEDWETLSIFLGGESVAGGKLKEAGTAHWKSPNDGATNSSGFTAFAGGARFVSIHLNWDGWYYSSGFDQVGAYGYWWSTSSGDPSDYKIYLELYYKDGEMDISAKRLDYNAFEKFGQSVRCIKN